MSYTSYYDGGWKANKEGNTPITPDALNHIDKGIKENEANIEGVTKSIDELKKADSQILKDAKAYTDNRETKIGEKISTNLVNANAYTDAEVKKLNASISANSSAISALDKRLGKMSFEINSADNGLDIIID